MKIKKILVKKMMNKECLLKKAQKTVRGIQKI